jgi:hypothetical protein
MIELEDARHRFAVVLIGCMICLAAGLAFIDIASFAMRVANLAQSQTTLVWTGLFLWALACPTLVFVRAVLRRTFRSHAHSASASAPARPSCVAHGETIRLVSALIADRPGSEHVDIQAAIAEAGSHLRELNVDHLHTLIGGTDPVDQVQLEREIASIPGEPPTPALEPADIWRMAVHEAGHALIAALDPNMLGFLGACLQTVTNSGGVSFSAVRAGPRSRSRAIASIAVDFGGVEAERLVLSEISLGADDDSMSAATTARILARCDGTEADEDILAEGRAAAVVVLANHQLELVRIAEHLRDFGRIGPATLARLIAQPSKKVGA